MRATRPVSAALALTAFAALLGGPSAAQAGLTITPTFTSNFTNYFGANAAAAENAWKAAANVFESNFTDNIHVNITVDAVSGTSVFGQSNTFLYSSSFSNLQSLLNADATTADDATAVGVGGSAYGSDPTGGTGTWWVSSAQAKAIGLISDNLSSDGTTTFGAGYSWTFSGPIAAGTYDFQGVAAHEISEVMGRLGISGGTIGTHLDSFSLIDLFSYSSIGTRGLGDGGGNFFSIDAGKTLLKEFNNAASNGLDSRDWAPGTNDAFNQYSNAGVLNPVSAVDLRLMDVLGYDYKGNASPAPEPVTLFPALSGIALLGLAWRRRRLAA